MQRCRSTSRAANSDTHSLSVSVSLTRGQDERVSIAWYLLFASHNIYQEKLTQIWKRWPMYAALHVYIRSYSVSKGCWRPIPTQRQSSILNSIKSVLQRGQIGILKNQHY